jgi:succinate dehydrogenase / fumarate reductase, cytochrome b subunit
LYPNLPEGIESGQGNCIDQKNDRRTQELSPMADRERPFSPNLQIYRPQITSVLSITHRLTGVALSIGSPLLVFWLIAAAAGPSAYGTLHGFLGSRLGLALLFG